MTGQWDATGEDEPELRPEKMKYKSQKRKRKEVDCNTS